MGKKNKLVLPLVAILISVILLITAFEFLIFTPPYVIVDGVVTDESGKPIEGAEVSIANFTTTTNANGTYSLKIPCNLSDTYNLTVKAKGYNIGIFPIEPARAGSKCKCNVTLTREKQNNVPSAIWDSTKLAVDGSFKCEGNQTIFLFIIRGVTNTSYIRNFVAEIYENGSWLLPEKTQISEYYGEEIQQNISGYTSSYKINFGVQPLAVFGGFIPSVLNPNQILLNSSLQYYTDQQIFFSPYTFTQSYNVSYTMYTFSDEALREAKVMRDERYLNLTSELLENLRPLALKMTQNFSSPFEKALAIEDYLRQNYIYDKNYTSAPEGVDPIEWFLFHTKRGVCTHFNSAFVLLARSIGIPSRLCAGYLIDPAENYQIIKPCQKHAYAEVLFENLGWITFDATAPGNLNVHPNHVFKIVYPQQKSYISGSKITIAGIALGFYKNAEFYSNNTDFSFIFWDNSGNFAFENNTFIPDGKVPLTLGISDTAGNSANDTVEFTVDNTPPIVNIYFPTERTRILSSTIFVNGTIQELNKGNLKPYINDSRFNLISWDQAAGTFSFVNNTDILGETSIKVSFNDLAGNIGSDTVTFTVENQQLTRLPTRTVITYCSPFAIKGSTFHVEGNVTDINGKEVDDPLNVIIYITEDKSQTGEPCGQGKVERGIFNITCYADKEIEVGNYTVVAYTIGDSQYEGSWSDPPITIMAETQIDASAPTKIIMGRQFTLSCTLKEKLSEEPIANKTITLTIGEECFTLQTNNHGQAFINLTLWTPGNYTATFTFEGSQIYINSTCSTTISVLDITISPTTNETLIRSESALLSGHIHAEEIPLDFEPLIINLNGTCIAETTTDNQGYFNVTFNIPSNQPLGPTVIQYILKAYPRNATQNVKILARTFLTCNATETLKYGDRFNVTATLKDETDQPIGNVAINLTFLFNGDKIEVKNVTDTSGRTKFANVTLKESFTGNFTYTLTFDGNSFYLPSSYFGIANIAPPPSSINTFLVLAAVLPVSAGTIAALIWHRRRKKNSTENLNEVKEIPVGSVQASTLARQKVSLNIIFPQIKPPFPLVWGVGEPLLIKIKLADSSSNPFSSASITISFNGKETVQTNVNDGYAEITKIFKTKAVHKINAAFSGNEEYGETSAEVNVKIVDYKEEIVELFNSFLKDSKTKFQGLTDEMTPREIQTVISGQVPDTKHKPLDKIISIFEVANYSLHPITRKDYEQMFSSLMEFEG